MRKYVFLIFLLAFLLCVFSSPGFAKLLMAEGEIQHFYETRTEGWDSYVLVKDVYGKNKKFFVHSNATLVKRGPQIEPLQELAGGMKVTILYREDKKHEAQASMIRIDGVFRA